MSSDPTIEKPRSLASAWVALALPFAVLGCFMWKSASDRAACKLNMRAIQGSVRSFGGMNGIGADGTTLLDQHAIIGPGKFIESEPLCPAGGTYTWSPVHPAIGTLTIRCSHRKHQLDPSLIADW